MRAILLTLLLTLTVSAQDVHVLSWLQADLDGDKVAERILIVSPDSPDPSNVGSKKELRVLKRKGDKYVQVHKMPLEGRFSTKMEAWAFEEPGTHCWGLSYDPAKKALMVCFTPNSGEFFWLVHTKAGYQVESSGD